MESIFSLGGVGLLVAGASAFGGWWLRRRADVAADGSVERPYPPVTQTPDSQLYSPPRKTHLDPNAFAGLPPLLLAHALALAEANGGIPNGNPFGIYASRFYSGPWSVVKERRWEGRRQVYRLRPIAHFWTQEEGVQAWVGMVGDRALAAAASGDARGYLAALIDRGLLSPAMEGASAYLEDAQAIAAAVADEAKAPLGVPGPVVFRKAPEA